jgi:protein involved in polysaccharide export with SLBB domain
MGAVLPKNLSKFLLVSSLAGAVLGWIAVTEQSYGQSTNVALPVAPDVPANLGSDTSAAALLNSMDALNDERKLGVGDRVSYRVVEDQKEPVFLTVTASGELQIPLLGLYHAAGKTCKELAEQLQPILQKDYYYHATVIIGLETVSTLSLGKVYLMGQVHTQGAVELPANESLTVSQAVLLNGGLADFADKHRVKLIRKGPDGKAVTTIVDIEAIYRGRSNKDPVLQPGDTVNVPEKLINF